MLYSQAVYIGTNKHHGGIFHRKFKAIIRIRVVSTPINALSEHTTILSRLSYKMIIKSLLKISKIISQLSWFSDLNAEITAVDASA